MLGSRWTVLAALALAACCVSSRAAAQKSVEDEARAQFDTGVELFEKGRLEQASIAFARAYELRPSYKILYLVGKCENAQGHFALSLDAYTRYLAEAGDKIDAARRDEVRTEIARLNSRVGMVSVETNAVGVTVLVDGRKSGTTPLSGPLFVDLGEHEVKLARGAEEIYREVVKVAGGQRIAVRAEVGSGTATAATAPEAPRESGSPTPPDAAPPAEKPKRVWTWVAFGVGGAAAIGAAITGGIYVSRSGDVKDRCDGDACPPSVDDDLDSAKALGNATTALIAVAGVGVAAGIVFYFVEPKWSKNESAVEVTAAAVPTAGGGALALAGRF
jgi:tetratricopeptide (TPR) repeat protein